MPSFFGCMEVGVEVGVGGLVGEVEVVGVEGAGGFPSAGRGRERSGGAPAPGRRATWTVGCSTHASPWPAPGLAVCSHAPESAVHDALHRRPPDRSTAGRSLPCLGVRVGDGGAQEGTLFASAPVGIEWGVSSRGLPVG